VWRPNFSTSQVIVNEGKQPHEMVVLCPKAVPAAKVLEILGTPPGQAPSPADQFRPHFALGLFSPFTVR
jgi:hypothetical protein